MQVGGQARNGRLFVWLLLAGLVGTLAGAPFTLAVLGDPAAGGPVDPRTIWLSAVAEALLFLAPASAVGVWLGGKVGLGPRVLSEIVSRSPEAWKHLRAALLPAMLVGLVLGLVGLSQYLLPRGSLGPGLANPTAFEWFLRSISAGLTEEIFFRLGLMTLFVWAIRSLVKNPGFDEGSLWVGNVSAALVFAGAHLPQIVLSGSAASNVVIPIVAVSTASGTIMGWVYMRYGFISAVAAHSIVDVVVYVVPKMLGIEAL